MTINKTAYSTTICSSYNLNKTISAIEAALYEGSIKTIPNTKINELVGGGALSNAVPTFTHPIYTKIGDVKEESLFVDSRSFGSFDAVNQVFKIRNEIEYSAMVTRAKLNYVWVTESPSFLRDVSPVIMAVYASWISESIGRRFALDPREQFNLAVLAAIFYSSQFTDEHEVNEQQKLRLVNSISRAIRASATEIMEILDKVPYIKDINEFCSHAEEVSGSIRLKELNAGLMYSILGGTWFGTNSNEMVAVAIEHPPTWITILISAFSERTYRNSQIGKLTERSTFKKPGEDFVRAVGNLIKVTTNVG